ncbi:Ig-like domain-containing protein [Nitrosopumilus ureiphilus]|nr:Ig-like domain-containing protein [Nitrosopumilus ureiphilus]
MLFTIVDDAYAIEKESTLEYNILPKKIHENDTVLLEVYKTVRGQVLLEKSSQLKVESLDKSIIDVVDLEETHDYKVLVKLKAKSEGETILYVFTEGSQSLEIPVTVHGNNFPKHISLDIFPNIIDTKDNHQGVLSLLLTDENGIPTRADKDYLVKLSTSKSGVVLLEEFNMIISKGDFGIKQIFSGIKSGTVTITAKSEEFESSESITVDEKPERTIEIAVIPDKISSSNNANGHLIAQLFSGGSLIKATEDITVYFEISSDSEVINTSLETNSLNPAGYFQIKKGQSWGHTTFSIQKGVIESYTITGTSQNPLISVEEGFDTMNVELYGDKEIKFSSLSILADGKRQLIGIIYLEDENGHPVIASRDIVVPFTASDESVLIETSIIKKGFNSALVYGNVGYFVPSDKNIAPKIQNSKPIELDMHGFSKDSVSIKTHLSSDIFLKDEQQWMIVFMESSDGNLFRIPEGQQIEISESEIFQVDKDKIEIFPYFVLIPITAIDTGVEALGISSGEFETSVVISSISLKPGSLNLDYSKKLFNGIKDSFVIQILDSQGLPVEIDEDVKIKIFSSDPSVIDFPKNVVISQKSNFVKLYATPNKSGSVEVSLVSEGLPIVTEEITIEDVTPTIQITGSDIVNEGESFIVSILAKQNGAPLQNVDVTWDFVGGISTIYDEKTGSTGEAVASIIATSDESVKILTSINNGPIQSAFASKIIKVNATTQQVLEESEPQNSFKKPDMGGFDPVWILIPGVIGGIVFYMKKKSK